MASREPNDADTSPPLGLKIGFGALVAVVFVMLGSTLGIWSLAATVASGGPNPDPGLDDYEAIESIEVENDTLLVRTAENPRFASISSDGDEVDYLKVVAEDGTVDQRTEINDGQRMYRFGLQDERDGNYTLTLIHHQPANPGIFGTPEKEYEQHVRFTVSEPNVTVTELPHEVGYE